MITAKINCSAIDKSRLFKGAKGTYLDIVLIDTPNGQYGDYMVVQAVTKEEREKGIKGPILGNGQTRGRPPVQQQQDPNVTPSGSRVKPGTEQANMDEDVPF